MTNQKKEPAKSEPKKIYTFNAKDYLLFPVMKNAFALSEEEVYHTISDEFDVLKKRLALKKIPYEKLKGALVPNQDKDRFETCFIMDTNQIESDNYGYYIFEKLIPLLDKKSTYSILCGDYIDILNDADSQLILRGAMDEVICRCNDSGYRHSGQYYLIYFNRLTGNQRWEMVEGLMKYPWFTGFADVTCQSAFKSYISSILCNTCIKNQKKIIVPHLADYSDEENVNLRGYPFEENGFSLISINEDSFGTFLNYKIESEVPDKEDVGFSFNALFPKFDSFDKIQLDVKEEKWDNYLTDKEKGKGGILEKLGYQMADKEKFLKEIYKKICSNYIYNLTKNEYGNLIFDVCVELSTINGHMRRTTIALEYFPDTSRMQIVTIT